jgi:hypothetical protein
LGIFKKGNEKEEEKAMAIGDTAGESALRQIVVNSNSRRSFVWAKVVCDSVFKKYKLTVTWDRARGLIRESKQFRKKNEEQENSFEKASQDGDGDKLYRQAGDEDDERNSQAGYGDETNSQAEDENLEDDKPCLRIRVRAWRGS